LGIVRTDATGWGALSTLTLLAGGLFLLALFVAIEGRVAPLAADAAADLLLAHAERGQRRGAAGRRRVVRDVVLPIALSAAGAGLLAPEGRVRIPADDAVHRGGVDPGLARGDVGRAQADASRRPAR